MGAKQTKRETEINTTDLSRANRTVSFKIDNENIDSNSEEATADLNFVFSKFAHTNFQHDFNHEFTKEVIDGSLLKLDAYADQIAALAVWITIQRFMGDLNEPQKSEVFIREKIPIMERLDLIFQQTYTKRDLKDAQKYSRNIAKSIKSDKENATDAQTLNPFLSKRQTSFLEKLHLITSIGILRPQIRDEIYCQICKQLTNNTNRISLSRGWILLSLCIGCFGPSEHFIDYLFNFIRKGPNGFSKYCFVRLKRTLANGVRSQPPSWLELKAARSSHLIVLPITFIDGSIETLYADSATTSKELFDALARKLKIDYDSDFTINIGIYEHMTSLGYDNNHVMDTISECEQYARIKNATHEQKTPWRLFLNRQVIVPNKNMINFEEYLVSQLPIQGAVYGETYC